MYAVNESAESPEGDGNYKKESDRNDKWKHNSETEKFRLNNRKLKKKKKKFTGLENRDLETMATEEPERNTEAYNTNRI